MSRPTFVYTLSDAAGRPLYVGCTSNLPQRLACHRRERHWWAEVVHIRLEHYADRDHGFEVEKQRIYELRPAHNFCHNPTAIGNCYVLPPGPETVRDRKKESMRRMHIAKGYAAIFRSAA